MPGIFGIILKDTSQRANLKSQFTRMDRYLSHFSYYQTEQYDGGDFIIGQTGIPYRGYRTVRYDEQSKKGMAFDGCMYGWRGDKLRFEPHLYAPVRNIEFEKFDDMRKVPALINGSFNTILFDSSIDSFYIANSRMGNRFLYYYENDSLIAFAPEIKAFLALDSFKSEIDFDGVANNFNYMFIISGRTLLKGVKRIYPASIIEINNRVMKDSYRYWHQTYTSEIEGDGDYYARLFYEKGEEVLHRQLGSNDKFMMALSGGMDSRLLAHYCAKSDKHFNYYAHGYSKSDDVVIATEVADTLGINQNFSVFSGDPQSYAKIGAWTSWLVDGHAILHSSYLLSVIREYPENPLEYEFLNSQFSGALNFGYGYGSEELITKDLSYEERLRLSARTYGAGWIDENYYALFSPTLIKKMKETFYPHIEHEFKKHLDISDYFIVQFNKFTNDCKALRFMNSYDLYRYVYNWHFSLIDDEIIEMLTQLPIRWAANRNLYTKIFCDLVADMAKIRYEKTGVDLYSKQSPHFAKNLKRKDLFRYYLGRLSAGKINLYDSHNYVQINQWYRQYQANRQFFEDILLDKRTLARGYYNEAVLRKLLNKQARGSRNFEAISQLANFELFNRYFIDREDPPVLPS